MLSEHWIRWIKASVNNHFKLNDYFMQTPEMEAVTDKSIWYEIRVSGPSWDQYGKDEFHGEISINILCSAILSQDLYALTKLTGLLQKLFETSINVFKLGDQSYDTQSLLGCLQRITPVDTIDWGRMSEDNRVNNTTIESTYKIDLTG